MGKGGQTIGFHYLFDILFGFGRGPVDELVEIKVADATAFKGSVSSDAVASITAPDLFGGEKKEGGIQGPFRLFLGRHDQVLPGAGSANCGPIGPYSGSRTLPDVKAAIGGRISEFRGVTTLWFSGLISSMNPYPKEWKFRVRRTNSGWYNDTPWYGVMAPIWMGQTDGIAPVTYDLGPTFYAIGNGNPDYPPPGSLHPGSVVLGPYAQTRIIRAQSNLVADDRWVFDGVEQPNYFIAEGTILTTLAAGETFTIQVKNTIETQCYGGGVVVAEGEPGDQIKAMNPAHIIYECLTNPSWGRGLPASYIDENSFVLAANTLCAETFGLCLAWQRTDDISAFIQIVLDHIGGALYLDPESGKMVLKLIRADYVVADLPLFTPTTGLVEINEDDSGSQDTIFTEVIGTGRDPITNEDFQMRVHNVAARQSQGASNTDDKPYPGIPTRSLMARVIQRDLRIHASGLKRFTVTLDRRGWRIRPGMCFRVQDTRRGIVEIVLRAGEIEDKSYRDGKVIIKAMQDVYSMPATSFITPVYPDWSPPSAVPVPPVDSRLVEANYRDVFRRSQVVAESLDASESYIGMLALSPDPTMYQYDLASRAAGEPEYHMEQGGSFTGAATLLDAIGPYDTTFELTGETDFTEDLVGQVVLVGDEQMGVTAYDATTHMLTVERGVADTIPAAHAAATTLWTLDDDLVSDNREYATGETVEAAALTRTRSAVLGIADADVLTLEMVGRQGRPYPPGDFKIDGLPAITLPSVERDEPVLTWTHRDRLLQEEQIVGHTEASVGPEAGVTYTIRIYDDAAPGVVLRTETAIAGTTWTYTNAMQAIDGDPYAVYVELESVRDGLASYQHYRVRVVLNAGYGLDYGYNYGGA